VEVSFFKNLRNKEPDETYSLIEILDFIKNGKWKSEIEACRLDLTLKNSLPSFTPNGIFQVRNNLGLIQYSGIVCLDIDNVDDIPSLKRKCKSIPWVWVTYVTPSGKGLKVFVKTESTPESFKYIEQQVAQEFFNQTGLMRDNRAKDLARLQFISYDRELYLNPGSIVFEKRSH
jgi:hypothetical protein